MAISAKDKGRPIVERGTDSEITVTHPQNSRCVMF